MNATLPDRAEEIRANSAIVREKIVQAAKKAGRLESEITLVAVTKMHPVETVRAAIAAGLSEFGENYAQDASAKIDEIGVGPRWHFIGNLQSNKAHLVAGRCALIQTIDRDKIAKAIGRIATDMGVVQDVLVQVRLGDEETKSGAAVENVGGLIEKITATPGLRFRGFMGIAPILEANRTLAEPSRYFDRVKFMLDRLNGEKCDILSIGMSGDYEAAIASGSTMVRIGTAIFGNRTIIEKR